MKEKFFVAKRPILSRLTNFGFQKTEDRFVLEKDFFHDDFTLVLTVAKDGSVDSKVIDKMNDEEYTLLSASGISGGYVGDVRLAYESLLLDVASNCFDDVLFESDQANRIADKINNAYGVFPDSPWNDDTYKPFGVFRHQDSGKWFGLIMNIKRKALVPSNADADKVDVINLKRAPSLVEPYPVGVYPAYHMNHKLWISVLLDDTIPDDEIMELINASFNATSK